MRDIDIATEDIVVVNLMGNHFQINLVPKINKINNIFIIKFVDRIILAMSNDLDLVSMSLWYSVASHN